MVCCAKAVKQGKADVVPGARAGANSMVPRFAEKAQTFMSPASFLVMVMKAPLTASGHS